MKRKDLLVTIFGCTCLVSGLSIFGSYCFLDNQMQQKIAQNIKDSTIFIEKSSSVTSKDKFDDTNINTDLYLAGDAIESLDADQEIEEVISYTNVLEIPHLDIKAYVNDGSDKASLSGGVGRHITTAEIGQPGNCVIAGHSSATYNCIFNGLEEGIDILDEFYLYDSTGLKHKYYVTSKFICDPNNVGILYNSGEGVSTTTIYTCTNKGRQRFVVIGKEFTDVELQDFMREQELAHVNNMLQINELVDFNGVSDALAARNLFKPKYYNVEFLHNSAETSNTGLFGVVLGENAFDKEHIFDKVYGMSIGFDIGGSNNDLSEN